MNNHSRGLLKSTETYPDTVHFFCFVLGKEAICSTLILKSEILLG